VKPNLLEDSPRLKAGDSHHMRSGPAQFVSEFTATFGLLCVIWGCSRSRSNPLPWAVTSQRRIGSPLPHPSQMSFPRRRKKRGGFGGVDLLENAHFFPRAAHCPSARPSTFIRPFAVSPSIHPARVAVTGAGFSLGHVPLNVSST